MISWQAIVQTVSSVMDKYVPTDISSIDELLENDAKARQLASAIIAK